MNELEWLHRLLLFLTGRIRYTAAPLQEVLREAADGEFSRFPFLRKAAECSTEDLLSTWEKGIEEYAPTAGLSASDVRLWKDVGGIWGRTDRESQRESARVCEERLEEQLREARKVSSEKGRLCLSLGLIGGLAAALLLI